MDVRHRYLHWGLCILAVAILLVASTYKLSESPGIWLDEGIYTQLGMNVAQTGQLALQVAPAEFQHSSYISVGYPLIRPLALSYKLFGVGVVQGRAVMVVFILLFALASYWLMRRLYGPWVAAWSLLLLAGFPMLYGNGKSVLGEVPGLFFFILTLLALSYLEESGYRSWRWSVAAGLAAGLCIATKPIFLLVIGAVLVTLIIKRGSGVTWSSVVIGTAALLIPFAYWLYTQLGADVTLSSILHDYGNPYVATHMATLVLQNALRFFTETTPLYTALLLGIWATALFVRRRMTSISGAELLAFFFCLLIIASYLRLPGWYRYLFPATIIVLMFLPAAAHIVFRALQEKWMVLKNQTWLISVVLALLVCAQLYQTACSSYVAEYYRSTRTRDVTAALIALPRTASIFLYNVPELGVLLPTRQYYQYVELSPGVVLGADQLPLLVRGVPDLVVINASMYVASPSLFARYTLLKTVDRYDLLKVLP
ncbi:glycosyltransferase family 39 protein [Candidatus Kaiserbacteria bacterium]|nr:glycosyltransferase family 39 protein [Candidatus Kaiserbacteria bacterium]